MSKRFHLNQEDLGKILTGACMAVAGALLTYVTKTITDTDFGEWTSLVVAGWSIVANIIRKYIVSD